MISRVGAVCVTDGAHVPQGPWNGRVMRQVLSGFAVPIPRNPACPSLWLYMYSTAQIQGIKRLRFERGERAD